LRRSLEEIVERLQVLLFLILFFLPCSLYKREVIAKVASLLLQDPLRLRFPACIVGALVVMETVATDMKICSTLRTALTSAALPVRLGMITFETVVCHLAI